MCRLLASCLVQLHGTNSWVLLVLSLETVAVRCMRCAAEFAWADSTAMQCIRCSTSQWEAGRCSEQAWKWMDSPVGAGRPFRPLLSGQADGAVHVCRGHCRQLRAHRAPKHTQNEFILVWISRWHVPAQVTNAKRDKNNSSAMLNQLMAFAAVASVAMCLFTHQSCLMSN